MGLFNKKDTKPTAVEPPMKKLEVFKDESPVLNSVMQDVATEEVLESTREGFLEAIKESASSKEAVQEQIEEAVKEEPVEEAEEVEESETDEEKAWFEKLNIILINLDSRITNLEAAVFRAISGKQ